MRGLSNAMTKSNALAGVTDPTGSGPGFGSGGGGSMNILIVGLDSRLDQNGRALPAAVLDQLHAGDGNNGGYNTNVMMLLHLPGAGDGEQPVGISIPRDDYVSLPGRPDGVSTAKIKEGYGLAKAEAEQSLRASGVRDAQDLERQGREAGRRQTIETVQDFLGVRIDHFVEVTLVGFYDLAHALGQITVCLSGPTQDSYSGARFDAGRQELDAAQALAFVRQRRDYTHPELNFTDLDRARRQQAFLASVAFQLRSAGVLANPAKMRGLIDVASKDVVVDDTFDILQFAQNAAKLAGGGLSFTTLPVKAFRTVGGQAVNLVDNAMIKKVVRRLLGAEDVTPAPAGPTRLPGATLDIINASGRDGIARTLATSLVKRGLVAGRVSTDRNLRRHTSVTYGPGADNAAAAMADLLDGPPPESNPAVPPDHLRLIIGTDFTTPTGLDTTPDTTDHGGPDTPASTPTGGGVPTTHLHTDAIPCVK